MTDFELLELAMLQAREAAEAGEVPVGAVVARADEIVGVGQNRVLRDLDPTAHAEIVALRQAARRLSNYRLTGCRLYSTLEPCPMCAGAMIHARIQSLVYCAGDPKAGAVSSVLQVLNHPGLNHRVEVTAGTMAEKSADLLRAFFKDRRER